MKKISWISLFMAISVLAVAQNEAKIWPVGYVEFPGVAGFGNTLVTFENGGAVSLNEVDLKMNFESTMAVGADSTGKLLFYSNGCSISDAGGNLMPNGDGLNPGQIRDLVCPKNGYICPRGAMVLPDPANNGKYYLFHQAVNYDVQIKLKTTGFYFSVIDMKLNSGKGAVLSKNNLLLSGDFESFAAARHANGNDWWLIMPEFSGNRYFSWRFDSTGISLESDSAIGSNFNCKGRGTVVFSKNGEKMARFDGICRAVIFDFDRCTGKLSKPIEIAAPKNAFGGGGAAFSPSGQFLFCSNQNVLLRANLALPNPKLDTVELLDIWTIGTTAGFMQLAPDDKIYISPVSRASFWHRISSPDSIADEQFVPKYLTLKGIGVRTMSNFPNFKLGALPHSLCQPMGLPPMALFTWEVADILMPLQVSFSDSSVQNPTFWHWDFRDGSKSTDQNPKHVYLKDGVYNVCLIVGNGFGMDTFCLWVTVLSVDSKNPNEDLTQPVLVFPNPTTGKISIQIRETLANQQPEFILNDFLGRKIEVSFLEKSINSIDISNLPPAIYFSGQTH